MTNNLFGQEFQLFYESPINIPAPYHFEAVFTFSNFYEVNPSVKIVIQYIDREDFSKEELLDEGLSVDNSFEWTGSLPVAWQNRLKNSFEKYKSGSCNPKDAEPFITIELKDTSTRVPRFLAFEENLIQEFLQAIFENAGKELPLFLGFQFKDIQGNWYKFEGELSFFDLNFTYTNGNTDIQTISDWETLQDLIKWVFIAEFQSDKSVDELKSNQSLAIYPGDGRWYIAGDSLRKPSGNNHYFNELEDKLRLLFL